LEGLYRLTLALGVGLFVGLEREWRGKEAGIRTFGFVGLLGGMSGLLGEGYALVCLLLTGLLVLVLNWQSLRENRGAELTTSAALLVTALCGVLCGQGGTVMPMAVGVVTAGLLSSKETLAVFSRKMTAVELRAEIQLAILTFAVYPILPTHAVDPWGLVEPRAAWMTVILIAAIGFVNYVLWKIYAERGTEITGFLGGLVNSTVAVTELSNRLREGGGVDEYAYRGVLLATAAMALRNAFLLAILDFRTFVAALAPLLLILLPCVWGVWHSKRGALPEQGGDGPVLPLQTPFSLGAALKFGLIFLVMQLLAGLAQDSLGRYGFYAVSFAGGLVSSASAVASAAVLVVHGKISATTGGIGAVLASLASAATNLILAAKLSGRRSLAWRLASVLAAGMILSMAAALLQSSMALP
jgi:uncharacterized membrane protein (DUF4010 family)